jgi:predicted HD phosphohydrolase
MLTSQKGLALGCSVDLYEHGLQTATRCYRDLIKATDAGAAELTPAGLSTEDEELVVVALLHDSGETLSPVNHGEVAASVLRPYISPRNYWVLCHHEIFQSFYYGAAAGIDHTLRDELKSSPHWHACERFCLLWDQTAFDGEYDFEPLDFFTPMVQRVLSKPAYAHPEHKEEHINQLKATMGGAYPSEVA